MDDGYQGVFKKVYFGQNAPLTTYYLVKNLTTGLPYRFQISAYNKNGES